MSRAIFIENVAKKGKLSKAEAKRTVDLVLGEIEAGLKKSKKAGRYTIGNFGTFSIVKRKGRKGRNPQTGEAIRIRASKALRFRPPPRSVGLPARSNPYAHSLALHQLVWCPRVNWGRIFLRPSRRHGGEFVVTRCPHYRASITASSLA